MTRGLYCRYNRVIIFGNGTVIRISVAVQLIVGKDSIAIFDDIYDLRIRYVLLFRGEIQHMASRFAFYIKGLLKGKLSISIALLLQSTFPQKCYVVLENFLKTTEFLVIREGPLPVVRIYWRLLSEIKALLKNV